MSKPLMLSIGGPPPEEASAAAQAQPAQDSGVPAATGAIAPSAESLTEVYQALKRHEETLRDLIVEVRLLYHNLSEKEQQHLEARRGLITQQGQEAYGAQVRALEEKIARAAAGGK